MKKYVALLLCLILACTSVPSTFAAGDYIDSSETLFCASSSSHNLFLSKDGVVAAWGDNTYGQCGLEPCDEVTEINYIKFDSKIVKVAAGNGFSIALDENGVAWGWGDNLEFQLGISRSTDGGGEPTEFSTPQMITDNIADIAVGEEFSILLTRDGDILYSGAKKFWPLYPMNSDNTKIKSISANANYNRIVAIAEDNAIFYWHHAASSSDVLFMNVDEVQSAVVGKDHVIIRCLNGENIEYYGYGYNYKHQLGIENLDWTDEPVLILSIPYEENLNFTEFAGEYNTVVNVWDGQLSTDSVTEYSWGTDCYHLEDIHLKDNMTVNKQTIVVPESYENSYQTIAVGSNQNMVYDFGSNSIILYGNDTKPEFIQLIGADEDFSVKDVISMRRYISKGYGMSLFVNNVDFVKDGRIDVMDIILLRRYVAGGYGVEL